MPGTGARGVVVIEDDPDVRELLITILEGSGYAVTATAHRVATASMPSAVPSRTSSPWTWRCRTSTAWSCAG